jgi:signal transduction histidine kinase
MDIPIMAFGIFLNNFPYFMLGMALMWNHLRYSRRHAITMMTTATVLHAVSIMVWTYTLPPDTLDKIRLPHEIAFMGLFVAFFIWVVKFKPSRLLFMAFFVKYFADLITSTAAFLQSVVWSEETFTSFGWQFNLMHLALLCITYPLVYWFIRRVLVRLYLTESSVWRFLWAIPASFYALLLLYSRLNYSVVSTGSYIISSAVLFGISLLVYALVLETLRTAQKKASVDAENAALEKHNRMKTEFLQDIKHEVRNPLHVISLRSDFVNMCLDAENQTEEARNALRIIQNEALRLGRMVNGMVELAVMGGEKANRKKIDFAEMLTSCAETSRLGLQRNGNTLRIEIAPSLPHVYTEAEQLMRVPVNLLENANNSTQNGEITIQATAAANYITVKITDTGEGIPAELLPRIFERGVSGKNGKGYGLSICRTIIEAHGGLIEIESERNKGTTVTFTIPVYGGQSEAREDD